MVSGLKQNKILCVLYVEQYKANISYENYAYYDEDESTENGHTLAGSIPLTWSLASVNLEQTTCQR